MIWTYLAYAFFFIAVVSVNPFLIFFAVWILFFSSTPDNYHFVSTHMFPSSQTPEVLDGFHTHLFYWMVWIGLDSLTAFICLVVLSLNSSSIAPAILTVWGVFTHFVFGFQETFAVAWYFLGYVWWVAKLTFLFVVPYLWILVPVVVSLPVGVVLMKYPSSVTSKPGACFFLFANTLSVLLSLVIYSYLVGYFFSLYAEPNILVQ